MNFRRVFFFVFLLGCVITTVHLGWQAYVGWDLYRTYGTVRSVSLAHFHRYFWLGFISAAPTLVFINSDNASKFSWRARVAIHFVMTIFFTKIAISFMWSGRIPSFGDLVDLTIGGSYLYFYIIFTVIYAGAYYCWILYQKKVANQINEILIARQLQAKYSGKVAEGVSANK